MGGWAAGADVGCWVRVGRRAVVGEPSSAWRLCIDGDSIYRVALACRPGGQGAGAAVSRLGLPGGSIWFILPISQARRTMGLERLKRDNRDLVTSYHLQVSWVSAMLHTVPPMLQARRTRAWSG